MRLVPWFSGARGPRAGGLAEGARRFRGTPGYRADPPGSPVRRAAPRLSAGLRCTRKSRGTRPAYSTGSLSGRADRSRCGRGENRRACAVQAAGPQPSYHQLHTRRGGLSSRFLPHQPSGRDQRSQRDHGRLLPLLPSPPSPRVMPCRGNRRTRARYSRPGADRPMRHRAVTSALAAPAECRLSRQARRQVLAVAPGAARALRMALLPARDADHAAIVRPAGLRAPPARLPALARHAPHVP
jgi:hypothetical protein